MPVAQQILAAVVATQTGIAPLVEFEPSGDPDTFPALAIYEGDWTPVEREAGLIRWQMGLSIEGYVESGEGEAPSAARTTLHAASFAALMADDTLGGLVELIEPGGHRNVGSVLSNERRLSFSQDFTLQFTTLRTNPALPG